MPDWKVICEEIVEKLNIGLDEKNLEGCFSYSSDGWEYAISFQNWVLFTTADGGIIYDDEEEYEEVGNYKTQITKIMNKELRTILDHVQASLAI